MLAQENDEGREHAMYYRSRMLNDAERRYIAIENIILSLYFACTKLRHYLLPTTIEVIYQTYVIKYMLIRPIAKSRVAKWAFALSEIDLIYVSLKAVKGQAVPDFIAEYPCLHIEEYESENYAQVVAWTFYFDGSSISQSLGIGILTVSLKGYKTMFKLHLESSTNRTEYEALIIGLHIFADMNVQSIKVTGNSQLVVKQLKREYQCLNKNIIGYFVLAKDLLDKFIEHELIHIKRYHNAKANELA